MTKGVSVHIGLNRIDPDHYQGWSGDLLGCEFDANDMTELATAAGFQAQTLLTEAATAREFVTAMETASQTLKSGDTLVLTFSGHGGQVPDTNTPVEADRMDDTWVLYDRQLVKDELYALWAGFESGVRIAIFADSSHSGTVARVGELFVPDDPALQSEQPRIKAMPDNVMRSVYESNRKMYDKIQMACESFSYTEVKASVIFTAGCQDNQISLDGERNGLFTHTLLQVWDGGTFRGDYRSFRKRIAQNTPPWQSPNLFVVGVDNPEFIRERPFTILGLEAQ